MGAKREITEEQWAYVHAHTPYESANELGVPVKTVYNWLSGRSRPVVQRKPVIRHYGPVTVEWTPGEASRLDAIKEARMNQGLFEALVDI